MIRRLRRRHRRLILGLVLVLPAGFAWSVASRRPVAAAHELPTALAEPAPAGGRVLAVRDILLGPVILKTRLLADSASRRLTLELTPATDPREPDPLVYWSPEAPEPESGAGIPPEAVLLGSLVGTRTRSFSLPAEAAARDGSLLLYSLGHQSVLGAATMQTQSLLAGGEPPGP